jgi:hypothetical protein
VKQPHLVVKLAALVSSTLLVGGLVAYRAGAFDWLTGRRAPAPTSETSSTRHEGQSEKTTQPALTIIPSTKSGYREPVIDELLGVQPSGTAQQPASDSKQPAPTMLPGSKSFTPVKYLEGAQLIQRSAGSEFPPPSK